MPFELRSFLNAYCAFKNAKPMQSHTSHPERLAETRSKPMNLQTLQALLVKQGVTLGSLVPEQRAAALAVVWAGLPDGVMSEKQINEALKQRLGAAAQFIDTDHVELRRWLVDTGFLQRDGFGREYRRPQLADLPETCRLVAEVLPHSDVDAWAAGLRRQHARQREARRLAWEEQQKAGANDGGQKPP
jgi:Uncharacterized protein conserved in bacteria (DUF2087)